MTAVEDLRALVYRDPRSAAVTAGELAAAARSDHRWDDLSRALSVLGRARRSLGEIDLAERDLTESLAAARRIPDDDLEADARIGLAGVLSFAGRAPEAFEHLDVATRIGGERNRAYAALQRAIIQQRLGHTAAALAGYEAALPTLRAVDARQDLALVLMNRGVIRTQTGECDAAVADFTEAEGLFAALDHGFGQAQTRHGLGWAQARRGDIPAAMAEFDAATVRFAALGHEALEVDVDRIEVLIAAGLYADAGALAQATADKLAAAGNSSLAGEVWLASCRAALLNGDTATAAAYAGQARDLFVAQGAPGWEDQARLELARCSGPAGDPDELQALAGRLRDAGNTRGQAGALALAAVAAAAGGRPAAGDAFAEQCAELAGRLGLFEVRMQAAHARASVAVARDDREAALRWTVEAADDLARHRTTLAATDARAAVAGHARALADLGVGLALETGDPGRVLAATERARAGRGQGQASRPPSDPDLAALLQELRTVVAARHDAAEPDRSPLLDRQGRLEGAVARRLLATRAAGAAVTTAYDDVLDGLAARLDERCLVSLVEHAGRLHAVVVEPGGARVATAGTADRVAESAASALSALRAAVAPDRTAARRASARDLLARALAATDDLLGDGLPAGDTPLVLVVPPSLHALPWARLPRLRGRPVAVAPSVTWWLTADAAPPSALTRPALVAAGPRLGQAEREAVAVAASYPQAEPLTGSAATGAAVLAGLDGAPVAHLACHAWLRTDNPLWSSLDLADGPLYAYDLERADGTPPLVVLSGCDTGRGARAGDQLLGLAGTLLERGTRHVVASLCPLPDSPVTVEVMAELHRRLQAGDRPAAALNVLGSGPWSEDHAHVTACLTLLGAP